MRTGSAARARRLVRVLFQASHFQVHPVPMAKSSVTGRPKPATLTDSDPRLVQHPEQANNARSPSIGIKGGAGLAQDPAEAARARWPDRGEVHPRAAGTGSRCPASCRWKFSPRIRTATWPPAHRAGLSRCAAPHYLAKARWRPAPAPGIGCWPRSNPAKKAASSRARSRPCPAPGWISLSGWSRRVTPSDPPTSGSRTTSSSATRTVKQPNRLAGPGRNHGNRAAGSAPCPHP